MLTLMLYWIVTAIILMLIGMILPGIYIESLPVALLAVLVMGLVNISVRPLLFLLTLPVTILTLGLFAFVINALTFMLVAWLVPGFLVTGFWSALLASLLLTLMTMLIGGPRDRAFI